MVEHKEHYRAENGDQEAICVEPRDARGAEKIKHPPADDRTDDSEQNVQHYAFASMVYNFASNETGDQT
jgi:hypothetical protein